MDKRLSRKWAGAALVSAAIVTVTATQALANLIVDGSFESPVINFPWYEEFGTSSGDPNQCVTNCSQFLWQVPVNNVDIVSALTSTPAAYNLNQYLDLVGEGSTGAISQSFATISGDTYVLSFAYGNNPWSTNSSNPPTALVTVGNLSQSISHGSSTTSNINWTYVSYDFTANSSLSTLEFLTTNGYNNGGILLDDVSVTQTPLPAAISLFAGGLGVIGLFSRRRKRAANISA